jgi:hypothetical protein
MPYIGTSPSNGVRRVHTYTATASQTTFTGASSEGVTLSYVDTNYIDVFQNGVLLGSADYTSTSGTSVVLAQGASADDLIVIVVYDVFSVADTVSKTNGGSFDSAVTMSGGISGNTSISGDLTIPDKIIHDGDTNTAIRFVDADTVSFETGGSERARINSSGHLLVGKTVANTTDVGARVNAFGRHDGTVDGGLCGIFNRLTNAGNLFQFEALNTAVGFIAVPTTAANDISLASSRGGGIRLSDQEFIPCDANGGLRNNAIDLGHPSALFDDIRATNSSIITSSDKTLKQDIEELSDKEKKVAVACKGLMRKYRWKSRVEEKGDDARIHFGIMAQDLQDAFIAEGLDPTKYAMFCSDTVWEIDEKTTEDGKEIIRKNSFKVESEAPKGAIKREVLAVRYTELLAFIISAL